MPGRTTWSEISSFWDDLVACHDDVPKLLAVITRRVAEVVGDGAVLTTVSPDGDLLEPRASYHPDPEVAAFIGEVVGSTPYRIGEGIAGGVAADQRLAVVNGIQRAGLANLMQEQAQRFEARYPIHALLIVPLVAAGETVGTLGAVRIESTEDYGHDDVVAMTALAERAALALTATRTHARPLGLDEYRAIYEHSSEGMLFTAPDGRVLGANPAACELLGLSEHAICEGGRDALIVSGDPRTAAFLTDREATGRARAELPMRRGDGTTFTAAVSSSVFAGADGELRACVIFRDVSDEVAMREDLHRRARHLDQLAQHDALTGLRDRRGVVPAAEELLAVASRDQVPVQLVFLDVDNLKRINDGHGHGAGDLVLTRVAEAIRRATRAPDVCARIGGDEFVVMLGNATAEEARQVVTRIEEQLAVDNIEPIVHVSAGISSCEPEARRSFDELVERAETAMFAAKARGRFATGES